MRASVFIPNSSSAPRVRIALNEEEVRHLSAGLQAPKVNVEGDVTRGLLIRFSEHNGLTLRLTGKMVEFSISAQHIRAVPGKVSSQDIFTIKDRSDDGPVLRTGAFPREFFCRQDKNLKVLEDPTIVRARADKAFDTLQTNGSMKLSDLKEQAERAFQPATSQSDPDETAPRPTKNPPWTAPAEPPAEPQATKQKGPYDDLKEALALVNSYMEGLDDEVTLVLDNNRVKATKKVIVYQDL